MVYLSTGYVRYLGNLLLYSKVTLRVLRHTH